MIGRCPHNIQILATMILSLACAIVLGASYASAAEMNVDDALRAIGEGPKLVMKDRSYYAYGYEGDVTEGVPNGMAYGMGGMEKVAFDSKEKILYGVSEQGFITLIDYADGPMQPPQLPIVITDKNTYTDLSICSEEGILFATTKDGTNPGEVTIYKAAARSDNGSISEPELLHTIPVGVGPDHSAPNSDCSILAVANEGEGDYGDFLVNPEGSVSLIRGPFLDADTPPTVTTVSFPWSDDKLLEKGVHMPLTANAMEYWDEHSSVADDLNFTEARATYTPAAMLEPEWLVWSADEKYVLVNLQENAALVKVNVDTNEAEDIYSYGLKNWEETPIDIIKDDGCETMPMVPGLYTVRTPDSIVAIKIGDETYIATANEGDDVEYGDFEEKLKGKDIFDGSELGMAGATADPSIFDPASPMTGTSKYFNGDCNEEELGWCATSMSFAVGSSMVDYSDPTAPVINKLVGIGGRGISIYKLEDSGLTLVWDSGDEFEKEGCAAYPWAHNGIQDEEFADVGGALYTANEGLQETIDELNDPEVDGCEDGGNGQSGACPMGKTVDERSQKDGYAAEAIVMGEACGKTFLVTVSEKNSVGFLYDISNIEEPKLVQVFHLSPASETKNPTVAYEDRTLGEIDAESILFFSDEESPSGKAAVLFAGAFSSTTSFWEFSCDGSDDEGDMMAEDTDMAEDEVETESTEKSAGFFVSGSLVVGIVSVLSFCISM